MKVLQILVWLLLLMVCYDLVNYFLFQANEKDSASNSDARGWKYLGIFDGPEVFIGCFYQWMIIGGLCVISLALLRLVFRRPLPKSVDMWTSLHPGSLERGLDMLKPRRKDSFLTCGISDTTLDSSYIDDPAFEFPGRLSSEQLQVLLEELKFRTDEKFEGIDTWIQSSAQDSKQVLKRMERIETEISYIRHQIFVLMSSKGGPNLGIGEIPDNKDHINTLRDLSDILAQVKKQFKEDESNKEIKDAGDHDDDNLNQKGDQKNNECIGPGGDECIIDEQEESGEENDPISKELKSQKIESGEKTVDMESAKQSPRADDNLAKPVQYLEPESELSTSWENKEGSFLTRTSDKDDSYTQNPIDYEKEEENKDIWQFSCLDDIETEYQLQEKQKEEPSKERRKIPDAEPDHICKERISLSPAGDGNHGSHKNLSGKVGEKETISKNLTSSHNESPSINAINAANAKPDIILAPTRDKQVIERIPLLKRSVTFAPEQRSLSPSKMLPWLPLIKKEVSPSREQERKDYKIPIVEPVKGRRQSISCPTVEDKRQSRRTILERELTNLERRVSPTRNKPNRRNVRSKVAEYIRGVK